MQKHFLVTLLFLVALSSSVLSQERRKARVFFHSSRKFKVYDIIYGQAMNSFLFKKADLTRYIGYETPPLKSPISLLLGSRIQFLFVRDYTPGYHKTVRKTGDVTTVSVSGYESHPPKYAAVAVGKELFVFNGDTDSLAEDVSVFNALVKRLDLKIKKPEDVRAISELFTYVQGFPSLKYPSIVSKMDDIPEVFRLAKEADIARLSTEIKPIQIKNLGEVFEAVFFTWRNLPSGDVIEWRLQVANDGQIVVHARTIGQV